VTKYSHTTIVLIALVALAVAQTAPKKTSSADKPNLGDSFAKMGLKALLAIGDFKGTESLTGAAKDALADVGAKTNSASASETLMLANLTNFAIMRSTDNRARERIMQKAAAKLDHDGVQTNSDLALEKLRQDPELSAALDAINERESGCSASLEKAFRNRIAIPLPGTCSGK
jgi:hypothetical protein